MRRAWETRKAHAGGLYRGQMSDARFKHCTDYPSYDTYGILSSPSVDVSVQTFIDHLSEVLGARNPKLNKQDALWSAEIVQTALIGFLPTLAGRKTTARSRTIDALNQMLVRYLEPVLKPSKR